MEQRCCSICMNGASISLLEGLDTPQMPTNNLAKIISEQGYRPPYLGLPSMFDPYSHVDVPVHE